MDWSGQVVRVVLSHADSVEFGGDDIAAESSQAVGFLRTPT